MKNLFDAATYAGCRITSPDLRTIVIDGVGGTALRIVFRQHLEHWQVRVSAAAHFTDRPEPNHAPLCSGIEATPEIIAFWTRLGEMRFESETKDLDGRVQAACRIIEGGSPPKKLRSRSDWSLPVIRCPDRSGLSVGAVRLPFPP